MAETLPRDPDRIAPRPRPLAPVWSRRWQGFPTSLPPLIGREQDVAAVVALFHEPGRHLITLTGPGGVGKTRLALAVAKEIEAEFVDGAVFVPLAAISDPNLVLPAIARALDIQDTRERSLAEVLPVALRDRCLLLVLDNFEHLALPGMTAAADVAALLHACPSLTALVTSRSPLHLSGEQRFLTPPLAVPAPDQHPPFDTLSEYAAIAFFLERARWVDHEFSLGADNAVAVSDICRRLDGLPLAIELAAAWVRIMPPGSLLQGLQRRLPLLRGGAEDQPARLRTMRDAIAWSYDLLTPDEAHLFRRLAVFAGGFTLDAVACISRDAADPLDLLAALIDKGLVQTTQVDEQASRFTMLETVREFAQERLAECDEAATIAATHAAYMLDLAERAEPHLLGPDERQWQARCDAELGNFRAALAWSLEHESEIALRIGGALWVYWAWHHLAEGRRWLTAALARSTRAARLNRAKSLTTDGALAVLEGNVVSGIASAREAATLAEEAADPVAEGLARWIVASGHYYASRVEASVLEFDRALPLFDQATTATDRGWAAYARSHRGAMALMSGDEAQGLALYEGALARIRAVGSDGLTLVILSDYAAWLLELGETSRARGMLEEALALAADHRGIWLVATTLLGLALVAAVEQDAALAARRLGAIEAIRVLGGLTMPGHYQDRIDRGTALSRDALGEERYAAAWEEGRADPGAVVAAAMGRLLTATAPSDRVANAFGLSPREREVLAMLVTGCSDRAIADALFISNRTASGHVAAILAKLGARSRAEAAVRAVRDGLV